MASNSTIAHRFANRDYNIERGLKGNNTSIRGINYYSYSTVFGQWVDETVCIVYQGSTSSSSNKHKLYGYLFPDGITLLPYDDGGSYYYGYHGCELISYSRKWNWDTRKILINQYVETMYYALHAIVGGTLKNLDGMAAITIKNNWEYITTLCNLYKDTSVSKWLKETKGDEMFILRKKAMVRMMAAGTFDIPTLVDGVFGDGSWKSYYDYCARFRKAEDNKDKVSFLCRRLGIKNPYRCSYYSESWKMSLSVAEIKKLTAKERNDIHFIGLMNKELYDKESERNEKRNKNSDNAYKWITGYAPKLESKWNHEYRETRECRNMFTGVEYELPKSYVYGYYWLKTAVKFDYESFRKAEDKEQWIREFYAECEEVQNNVKGLRILEKVGAHTHEKERSYEDSRYIDDEFLRENTTESEYWYAHRFIELQEQHFADEEARRRAAEIARLKREEEERKEREYMEQVKNEQIDECIKEGTEGCRNLWRKHLTSIGESKERYGEVAFESDGDFFYDGNVLLRLNLNKDKVETSKDIRIPVEVCKKMWKIVCKWHENPACFKEMQIDTKGSGKYTISSYKNDILTAGCHKIAYTEMERMYNEIINA